jgi:hypothetical protein
MQVQTEQVENINEAIAITVPAHDKIGEQHLVSCPVCGSKTILFSRTIQTFCLMCATPVTRLDTNGMFYETLAEKSLLP